MSVTHPTKPPTGVVFNVQRYSLQDGPGIRTTVFLKGCPLDCWWCHNPEGRAFQAQMIVQEGRCIRCGACVAVCPQQSPQARESASLPATLPVQCRACGACVDACPTGAREWAGRRFGIEELLGEIMADRLFYDDSGGGVTFSGGEPLAQWTFLRAMLRRCRERGVHTAVDTCAFGPTEVLSALVPITDLFLCDLKFVNEARHRQFTGVSNQVILANLQHLAQQHGNLWMRIPIIPGINDTPDEVGAMANFVRSLGPAVRQINLLPYHRTGVAKFARLGESYRLPETAAPVAEDLHHITQQFGGCGVPVKIGG